MSPGLTLDQLMFVVAQAWFQSAPLAPVALGRTNQVAALQGGAETPSSRAAREAAKPSLVLIARTEGDNIRRKGALNRA